MRALLIGLVLLYACARAPREEPSAPTPSRTDASAWLGQLRAAHADADAARTAEARAGALDALCALAAEAAPQGVTAADEAAMRRDLYGRAARLALELARFAEAERLIQDGLALGGRDPFHSQLLLMSIETQRALGEEAAARGAEQRARSELLGAAP